MADNYLENKMEEHRRASAGVLSRRASSVGTPRGAVCTKVGELRILVTGCVAAPELAEAVIKSLATTGCKIAFAWADMAAAKLAQQTGSRHYPMADEAACARIEKDWGGIDVKVAIAEGRVCVGHDKGATEIVAEHYEAALADRYGEAELYMLLPISRSLAFRRICIGADGAFTATM